MSVNSVPEQFRAKESFETRVSAAELARSRGVQKSVANGEETLFRNPKTNKPSYIASFTKGLCHTATGALANPADFTAFVRAANSGDPEEIARLPLGPPRDKKGDPIWRSKLATKRQAEVRGWESMGAGLTFDLEARTPRQWPCRRSRACSPRSSLPRSLRCISWRSHATYPSRPGTPRSARASSTLPSTS